MLDQDLRVCRGNAGTLFALTRRRQDLAVSSIALGGPLAAS